MAKTRFISNTLRLIMNNDDMDIWNDPNHIYKINTKCNKNKVNTLMELRVLSK